MEPSAQMEKRKVLMGSAALYWGCGERAPSAREPGTFQNVEGHPEQTGPEKP